MQYNFYLVCFPHTANSYTCSTVTVGHSVFRIIFSMTEQLHGRALPNVLLKYPSSNII